MIVSRTTAATPICETVRADISQISGPCVGCKDCLGLCAALIDVLFLPDLILTKGDSSR